MTSQPVAVVQGECEKNVQYMVGFADKAGEQVPGHCQLSCGTCTLISPSGNPSGIDSHSAVCTGALITFPT